MSHSTAEAGELSPRDPVEGRGHRQGDQAGLLARHQGGEHGGVAHIATDEPVRPELPDLAPASLVGQIERPIASAKADAAYDTGDV